MAINNLFLDTILVEPLEKIESHGISNLLVTNRPTKDIIITGFNNEIIIGSYINKI